METLLDIPTLSIEEVTSRLLASEDNPEPTPNQVGGKLYLTEEQWVERFKQKEAENGRTNNSSGGKLPRAHQDQLQRLGLVDEDQTGGQVPLGGVAIERQEDRMALDAICSVVPSKMISTLVVKEFTKEVWESIRVMRIGNDRIRKTSVQRLRCQYNELALWDGEGVEDFAIRQWHHQSTVNPRQPGGSEEGRREVPTHRPRQV